MYYLRQRPNAFRFAGMAILLALVMVGCFDLGVQIGSDSDKAPPTPAYMAPNPQDQEYDPAMELYARAYNLNYSFWQTNYKALVESLGSKNVLETRDAYEQGRKNLMRMSRFLGGTDKEKLLGNVAELDKVYESIRRGVANRATEMRLATLERQVRGSFEPGVAQLVAPPKEEAAEPKTEPEKTDQQESFKAPATPLIGFGEKASQSSAQPDVATDMARYRALYGEWQAQHAAYLNSVRNEGVAAGPEPLAKLLEALRSMRLLLRDERKANHLQLYISEYERLRAEAEKSQDIEKLLRNLDLINKDIVAQFAP